MKEHNIKSVRSKHFLFKYPWFTSFIGALTISNLGDAILLIGLPWLVYDITKSSFTMGAVYFAETIPMFIVYPLAGVLVDKFNKRRIIFWVEILRAIFVALIPLLFLTGHLYIWNIMIIAPCLTALSITFFLALNSVTPMVVKKSDLSIANSYLQTVSTFALILGPILAGVLISIFGVVHALLFNSFSFAATAIVAFALRLKDEEATGIKNIREVLFIAKSGFQHVLQHKLLRALAVLSLVCNISYATLAALMVFILRSSLGLGAKESALVYTVMGISSLLGGIVAVPLASRFSKGMVMSVGLVISSIGILLIGITQSYVGILVGVSLQAGPIIMYNVINRTLRQESVPIEILGRVTSAYLMLATFSAPIAGLVSGSIVGSIGISTLIIIVGLIQLTAAIGAFLTPIRKAC